MCIFWIIDSYSWLLGGVLMVVGDLRMFWLLLIALCLSCRCPPRRRQPPRTVNATAPAGPGTAQRRAIPLRCGPRSSTGSTRRSSSSSTASPSASSGPCFASCAAASSAASLAAALLSQFRAGHGRPRGVGDPALPHGRWQLIEQAIGATEPWYCYDRAPYPRPLTGC